MYTGGRHTIKLMCFSSVHVSFITRVSAENLEGERGNYLSSPTVVIVMLGELSNGRQLTEASRVPAYLAS